MKWKMSFGEACLKSFLLTGKFHQIIRWNWGIFVPWYQLFFWIKKQDRRLSLLAPDVFSYSPRGAFTAHLCHDIVRSRNESSVQCTVSHCVHFHPQINHHKVVVWIVYNTCMRHARRHLRSLTIALDEFLYTPNPLIPPCYSSILYQQSWQYPSLVSCFVQELCCDGDEGLKLHRSVITLAQAAKWNWHPQLQSMSSRVIILFQIQDHKIIWKTRSKKSK